MPLRFSHKCVFSCTLQSFHIIKLLTFTPLVPYICKYASAKRIGKFIIPPFPLFKSLARNGKILPNAIERNELVSNVNLFATFSAIYRWRVRHQTANRTVQLSIPWNLFPMPEHRVELCVERTTSELLNNNQVYLLWCQ